MARKCWKWILLFYWPYRVFAELVAFALSAIVQQFRHRLHPFLFNSRWYTMILL